MNKVAAIIVTFNRKDKLLRCIDAVSMQTSDVQPDIILVDNNSSDGTGELIRQYISEHEDKGARILYHNLGYNSGGAGGFCFGLRKAAESGYDFMWLMDDDCIPAPDALEQFLRSDRSLGGDYGFLSGRVLWKDGTPCVMNIQRQTVTRNISFPVSDPVPVEMASFASLFIPAGIVREADVRLTKAALSIASGNYPQEGLSFWAHMAGLFGQRLWFYNKTTGDVIPTSHEEGLYEYRRYVRGNDRKTVE